MSNQQTSPVTKDEFDRLLSAYANAYHQSCLAIDAWGFDSPEYRKATDEAVKIRMALEQAVFP